MLTTIFVHFGTYQARRLGKGLTRTQTTFAKLPPLPGRIGRLLHLAACIQKSLLCG
jgi:hypothetical protein